MRRIVAVFVGIVLVGLCPSAATAQDSELAALAAQVQAMQATITAQAQQMAVQSVQIATLLENGQIQMALVEDSGSPYTTSAGTDALGSNEAGGKNNSAFGYKAIEDNTEGDNNTATGANAIRENTGGEANTATGYQALYSNNTGHYNAAI